MFRVTPATFPGHNVGGADHAGRPRAGKRK